MKKFYVLLSALILAVSLMAQAPQSFNYQAVVRDASGNIIANTQVGMRINIIQGSILDTAVCKEEFTPTTNDFGLVTLAIGSINTTDFVAIDWSAGPYFVKVELDPAGGTSYVEMGTSQLLSVPYALHARTVEKMDLILDRLEVLETRVGLYVKDIDGNVYNTVTIGTQTWMKENLKTTHHADGTAIPLVTGDSNWDTLKDTSKAYCWYDDDSATNANTYGALYTWPAAINGFVDPYIDPDLDTIGVQGVCPTGWHLPSNEEWKTLIDYLGGEDIAGGKLKETGITHWQSPNEGTTNESGFTALPGGYRDAGGAFIDIGYGGNWWSSTGTCMITGCAALYRSLHYITSYVSNPFSMLEGKFGWTLSGFSVRCLRNY
jgi:uncharacterized protein (TIGR02145 family)